MNRYQQIIGDKKTKNAVDTKFFMNQEGFYSPIREYKKYKKMEEFQLPDIKKYMFLPLKSERNRQSNPSESEPTAFQNYKKSQQVSLRRIEDRVEKSKNNEFQQIELQSQPNNNPNGNGDVQNQDTLKNNNNNVVVNQAKNNLRLSLQNILQKSSLQQMQQQQSPHQNESHLGYNVIQSHRFRVSSLEKMRKAPQNSQLDPQQKDTNNEMNDNSQIEINPKLNSSINNSINGIIELGKINQRKAKRQVFSYHFDSSQNLHKDEAKVFGLSDLYQNLRQSLEQIKQGGNAQQPQLLSERNGLRCKINNNDTQNENEIKKTINIKKNRNLKNSQSNILSDAQGTFNILMLAQKQMIDKDIIQSQVNASNDNIELIIKRKNPYLSNQITEVNPHILNKPPNISSGKMISDDELIKTEVIDKRKNQYTLSNQVKSGENSPLFGSTRFLNFLPHHIKKKKIQLNLQFQQSQGLPKATEMYQEDTKYQYIQTSDTFTQSPHHQQNKDYKSTHKLYTQNSKEIYTENKQKPQQNNITNINTTTSLTVQLPLDSEQKSKVFQKSQVYSNTKQLNNSQIKDNKNYQNKNQGSERLIYDFQPQSYRDNNESYYQQQNTKVGKIKIEEQSEGSRPSNKNRLTFTQFLPWENPQRHDKFKQQINAKIIHTSDNSPRETKGYPLQSERILGVSNYEKRFIDFDINDYFELKDNHNH